MAESEDITMKNLNEMTTKELKEMAKELKISNWWNLKKAVLIEKIEEAQNMSDEEKQEIADQKAKEDAALAEYRKDWRKYTARFNPIEFIEKFRSGDIVLDCEDSTEEPVEEETTDFVPMPGTETPDWGKNHWGSETGTSEPEEIPEQKPEGKEDQQAEQPKPKRGALIEFDGKSQNICKWGEELDISPNTLYGRIYKMNWSVERAFTTPARKGGKK